MIKILKRYGGVILFAIAAAMEFAILTLAQEFKFAAIFFVYVIMAFLEGWLTHGLFINPVLSKLRKDNIRYMTDNMALMGMIEEEREKNEQT